MGRGLTRGVLFIRIADGVALTEELEKAIRTKIRVGASPRHVPAKILVVDDIPRTKSGKDCGTWRFVKSSTSRPVKNKEALANPEALEHFANREELQS